MEARRGVSLVSGPLLALLMAGCIATRSSIDGRFEGPASANLGARPVSVLFVFRHESQMHGFDSIPKVQLSGVKDFDSLFGDALRELGNVARYQTFTVLPNDVNDPGRRDELASTRQAMDYVIEVDLLEESSFWQQCLAGTFSTLSLTLLPMPYDWDYTLSARVFAADGSEVASLRREATLTSWMQALLIFAYPFFPFEGEREELYSESLHDLFRQIETQRILS